MSPQACGLGAELDHLVVAARTLEEGVAWCERTLGIVPDAGGRHALMGTHNRVFAIGSPAFARTYFEIIAIDPEAAPPGRARWFDFDDLALQATLARGPQLVHWVARTAVLDAAVAALAAQSIDAGRVLQGARSTPQGELRWRFAMRDDGARLLDGALPMLIEWGAAHPADALADSGVTLTSLALGAHDPVPLQRALRSLGFVAPPTGGPALCATLNTPRGSVTLSSPHGPGMPA